MIWGGVSDFDMITVSWFARKGGIIAHTDSLETDYRLTSSIFLRGSALAELGLSWVPDGLSSSSLSLSSESELQTQSPSGFL